MPVRWLLAIAQGEPSAFSPPPPDEDEDAMRNTSVRRTTDYTSQNDNDFVAFDTEILDDDGLWVIGDPTKIGPIPASREGYRGQLHTRAIWAGGTGGTYRECKIFRNGDTTAPIGVTQIPPANGNTSIEAFTDWIELHEDDYFTVAYKTATDQSVLAADDYSMNFEIAYHPPPS